MWDRARHFFFVASLLTVSTSFASAAPPASCAHKFIGTWVYAGGTTVVAPGGIAYPKCAMCVGTQTWTCQGNTYLFSNSGPPGQFSSTLSPDGRQLIGSGVVATRVGGAARDGGSTANKAAATSNTKEHVGDRKDAAPRKPASCSDITGTKNDDGSRMKCPEPKGKKHAKAPATHPLAPPQPPAAPSRRSETPNVEEQLALVDRIGRREEVEIPAPTTPPAPAAAMPSSPPGPTTPAPAIAAPSAPGEPEVISMDPKTCDASVAQEIRDLYARIDAIRRSQPSVGEGPQVNVGSCNSRLRKLFGNFEDLRTYVNLAAYQEERSCLELKINYLRMACQCSKYGLTFSTNEAVQDQTLEAFSAVRRLEIRARNEGIRNPIINRIVTEAADRRDCYNLQTIEMLRDTEHVLERVLAR
jgi:hypothetical protein